MTAPVCLSCGRPIPSTARDSYNAWQCRKFCDMTCRRAYRPDHTGPTWNFRNDACRSRTTGRIEDVEWLLAAGEAPNQIASRLGMKPHSLGRWLERHDRRDLARPFYRIDWHERAAA